MLAAIETNFLLEKILDELVKIREMVEGISSVECIVGDVSMREVIFKESSIDGD